MRFGHGPTAIEGDEETMPRQPNYLPGRATHGLSRLRGTAPPAALRPARGDGNFPPRRLRWSHGRRYTPRIRRRRRAITKGCGFEGARCVAAPNPQEKFRGETKIPRPTGLCPRADTAGRRNPRGGYCWPEMETGRKKRSGQQRPAPRKLRLSRPCGHRHGRDDRARKAGGGACGEFRHDAR